MILHGHVAVLVKECQVATLGPGETFGELGLQNLEKRTATVKASGSGRVGAGRAGWRWAGLGNVLRQRYTDSWRKWLSE